MEYSSIFTEINFLIKSETMKTVTFDKTDFVVNTVPLEEKDFKMRPWKPKLLVSAAENCKDGESWTFILTTPCTSWIQSSSLGSARSPLFRRHSLKSWSGDPERVQPSSHKIRTRMKNQNLIWKKQETLHRTATRGRQTFLNFTHQVFITPKII